MLAITGMLLYVSPLKEALIDATFDFDSWRSTDPEELASGSGGMPSPFSFPTIKVKHVVAPAVSFGFIFAALVAMFAFKYRSPHNVVSLAAFTLFQAYFHASLATWLCAGNGDSGFWFSLLFALWTLGMYAMHPLPRFTRRPQERFGSALRAGALALAAALAIGAAVFWTLFDSWMFNYAGFLFLSAVFSLFFVWLSFNIGGLEGRVACDEYMQVVIMLYTDLLAAVFIVVLSSLLFEAAADSGPETEEGTVGRVEGDGDGEEITRLRSSAEGSGGGGGGETGPTTTVAVDTGLTGEGPNSGVAVNAPSLGAEDNSAIAVGVNAPEIGTETVLNVNQPLSGLDADHFVFNDAVGDNSAILAQEEKRSG
jgi:hypothetical protein